MDELQESVESLRLGTSKTALDIAGKFETLTAEAVVMMVFDIYTRCIGGTPVLVYDKHTRTWNETGEWKFDASNALKALQLLGDAVGAFKKQVNLETKINYEELLKEMSGGYDI